jgi:hypothetical protein
VKRLKPTEIDRDSRRLFEQEARILYGLGQVYLVTAGSAVSVD